MIEFIGVIAFIYLFFGVAMTARNYVAVKDAADAQGVPRWYLFVQKVLLWLPDRILTKKISKQ